MLSQHGLRLTGLQTDKIQLSSVLLSPLALLVAIATWFGFKNDPRARQQNSRVALYGRKLIVLATKI
jgi:hypothetical protein